MPKFNFYELLDKIDSLTVQKEEYKFKLAEAEAYLFCAKIEYEKLVEKFYSEFEK